MSELGEEEKEESAGDDITLIAPFEIENVDFSTGVASHVATQPSVAVVTKHCVCLENINWMWVRQLDV